MKNLLALAVFAAHSAVPGWASVQSPPAPHPAPNQPLAGPPACADGLAEHARKRDTDLARLGGDRADLFVGSAIHGGVALAAREARAKVFR